jgi:hypothetical protein
MRALVGELAELATHMLLELVVRRVEPARDGRQATGQRLGRGGPRRQQGDLPGYREQPRPGPHLLGDVALQALRRRDPERVHIALVARLLAPQRQQVGLVARQRVAVHRCLGDVELHLHQPGLVLKQVVLHGQLLGRSILPGNSGITERGRDPDQPRAHREHHEKLADYRCPRPHIYNSTRLISDALNPA